MKTIVGIDPGDTGAIVAIHPDGLIEFHDTPLIVTKTKKPRKRGSDPTKKVREKERKDLDFVRLASILAQYDGAVFGVEYIWCRPTMSKHTDNSLAQGGSNSSNFKGGLHSGALLGVLAAQKQQSLPLIPPITWLKAVGASGMSHEEYRQLAIQLYPQCAHELRLKKHHGRAAALLIAHYVKTKFAAEVAA